MCTFSTRFTVVRKEKRYPNGNVWKIRSTHAVVNKFKQRYLPVKKLKQTLLSRLFPFTLLTLNIVIILPFTMTHILCFPPVCVAEKRYEHVIMIKKNINIINCIHLKTYRRILQRRCRLLSVTRYCRAVAAVITWN